MQLVVLAPVIGTLTISDSFTAGNSVTLSDLNNYYKPTVTENGFTISAEGWQSCVGTDSWTDWSVDELPLDTASSYKLRYYVTYHDGATTITSNEVTLNIVGKTTALALTASPASSQIAGNSVTLTATLTGFFAGSDLSGQTITFKNGSTNLGTADLDNSGVAVFTWTPGGMGTYALTAEYAASAYNTAAASSTINYTVIVDPNIAAVNAAKTALVEETVNVAFGADQAAKTAAVQAYVNGLLTGDATGVTAVVTYNNGTGTYDVALSKGSVNDSKSLSMTINEAADPDIAIIAAAKTAAQNVSYADMTQAAVTDEASIKAALKSAAETAIDNSDITVTINQISYTSPIAGTSANPSGTNGSYTFTVTVSKGGQNDTTTNNTIIITANPYTGGTGGSISYAASSVSKTYGDAKFTNPLTQTTVNGTITYASDDTFVATVNPSTGEVTIISVGDGSAIITATAAETDTHAQATASYTVTVAKKALTIKAEDKSMTKGGVLPSFTYTATGLVNGDAVTTPPTMSATADGTAVGTFDITISGGVVANAASYDITHTKGTLTVAERLFPVTVTNGTGSGSYAESATVTITANDRSGYTFTGWSGADVTFTDASKKTTTFTMPAKAVTVTANYRQNSSGGNGGGNTSSPTPSTDPGKTDQSGGQIEREQQQNAGAPAANVNNSGDELKSRVFTLAEQEMMENGENAKVILKVTDISASVSEEEKKLIQEQLSAEQGNAELSVLYVDLSLYKQIGSREETRITETNGKIRISFEVPESFWNTDVTKSRAFYIVRLHEKEVTRIDGSYDPVTHLFTFETDRFSTYALSYRDSSIQTYQDFYHLQLTAKANKTSQTLSYKKAADVDGYLIYGAACGKEMKKLAEVSANTVSYTVKNLKQGTYYKYQVKAYRIIDGEPVIIMTSRVVHSVTEGKTYANPTKVTLNVASVELAVGKTKTVSGQVVLPKGKKGKEHTAAIRYESTDKKVAAVNSKGKITAKAKGSCYVYAYAQNGVYKRIKVTVE